MWEILFHLIAAVVKARREGRRPAGIAGPAARDVARQAQQTTAADTWVCGRCRQVNDAAAGFCQRCAGLRA